MTFPVNGAHDLLFGIEGRGLRNRERIQRASSEIIAQREDLDRERIQMLPQTDWSNPRETAAVVACLVKGAYDSERDRLGKKDPQTQFQECGHSFYFEKIMELRDGKSSSSYGVVYEAKGRDPSLPTGAAGPPRYVIAFRGTILPEIGDMKLNLRIIANRLHKDKRRFQLALQYVIQIVQDAEPENVWLAGHSLGSAIAMMIGRSMALEGKILETFLFNPPFLGSTLLKFNAIPYLGRAVQSTTALINMGTFFFAGRSTRQGQYEQFIMLSSWTPRLFVNKGDHICSGYLAHFKIMETLKENGAGMLGNVAAQFSVRRALKAARKKADPQQQLKHSSTQLLPKAYLTVAKTSPNFCEAHALKQWWDQASLAKAQFIKEHALVGGP